MTGWTTDARTPDTLVLTALNRTIGQEHPAEGPLIHTDRGAPCTSQRFQALLVRYEVRQNMNRSGNPNDDAIMVSFCRTL